MPDRTTAAKGAPAIAEKPGLVRGRIGIDDVDTAYTRQGKARGAIAGEVELPAGRASARDEEAIVARVVRDHGIMQISADFVRFLSDAGSDRGGDAGWLGAKTNHRGDSGLDHPGHCATRAGMGGGDHAR